MSENKNNSVALKAGAWYVVSTVVVKAVSVITTPIFTRLMTTTEYGITATFTTWYSLLAIFCTLNLNYSIGRAKLDFSGRLEDYIGSMQLLSSIVTGIFAAMILLFIDPVSDFFELNKIAVILLVIYLFFSPTIIFFQNGYRYRYKYKENIAIAWYTALASVLLSLVLILTMDGDKAILRIIGLVAPTVLLSLYFWIISLQRGHLRVNREFWRYGLILSLPLVLHTVSLNILAQSDRIFIAKICSSSDVGIYSLVYNYGILMSIITNSIADGWLPWFHDNYFLKNFEDIKKNIKLIVTLGCYISLACVAIAPEAIMILGGNKYLSGVYCVPPIVLGILCQYIYTHYVNIELHLKKTMYVSAGTIFAAALNVILNAIFIPGYGFVAAAYTTLFSYICLLFIHFFIVRYILKIRLYSDSFMFGAILVTAIISMVLVWTYSHNILRFAIVAIGLISMAIVYRKFIFAWIEEMKKNLHQ